MLSFVSKFKHSEEMRESKDEILIGEIIRAFALEGYPAIGFSADTDIQHILFKPTRDDLLYKVMISLDRKTGGSRLGQAILGSKATLAFKAEIKNLVADPDDLLHMYRTDMKNIFKSPILGSIKLDHQFNSVFAIKQVIIDIDKKTPNDPDGVKALRQFLIECVNELREKLIPYKKG